MNKDILMDFLAEITQLSKEEIEKLKIIGKRFKL